MFDSLLNMPWIINMPWLHRDDNDDDDDDEELFLWYG